MESVSELIAEVQALITDNLAELLDLRHEVTWKIDGSPVTEADIRLESLIRDKLTNQLESLTFIGEESFTDYTPDVGGWVAVLDPIDGTENFCSGLKEWGVALSIWRDAEHQGSMLMMPELGESLKTGDIVEPNLSRITGFSSSIGSEVVAGLRDVGEGRIMGCAVYNLFNVVTGRFNRFVNPVGAYSWDLLAGIMLALEHGCEVEVDGEVFDGQFLEPDRKYRVDVWNRHGRNPR